MKVLLLCSEGKEKLARPIKDQITLDDMQIDLLVIKRPWSLMHSSDLLEQMRGASHLLLIPEEKDISSHWITFALGFSMGRHGNVTLYGEFDSVVLPDWMRQLPKCQDGETLKNYYREEVLRWNLKIQKEEARREITDAGYALSAQAFSDRVAEGDRAMVQLYLKAGFLADARDDNGIPLLCTAVRNRHRILIPLLLNNGADIDAQDDGRLNSALMDAAADGLDDYVEQLLEAGANPDCISRNGQTALILAVGQGHSDVSERLIRADADVTVVDKLGMTALKYAKLFKNERVIALIEDEAAS